MKQALYLIEKVIGYLHTVCVGIVPVGKSCQASCYCTFQSSQMSETDDCISSLTVFMVLYSIMKVRH